MRAAVVLACLLAAIVHASRAAAEEPRTFGVAFHVVPGVRRETLEASLAHANQLFAGAGVAFTIAEVTPIDVRHASIATREDRDALGAYRTRRTIDVFVVNELVDVDTPPLRRRGVHWRDRTRPGVRYVIEIESASPWVLAHELGHYFGNPHSDVPGNVMCYTRGEGDPVFDDAQRARIRRSARRLTATLR